MATDWRELASRLPERTIVRDPSSYADVFAAIDEALTRAATWEASPTDFESLGKVKQRDEFGEEELVDFVVCRVPAVPVRVPSSVRLCVALLQFQQWDVPQPLEGACLPHVGKILRRKLRPTLSEAVDLAGLMITRIHHAQHESYTEPLAEILNLIERNFDPPVPEPLAVVLREARRRVAVCRENYVTALRAWRGRPQTKRFDKWDQRLARLLGK